MKKRGILWMLILFLAVGLFAKAEINKKISFSTPSITDTRAGWTEIKIKGTTTDISPYKPQLPLRTVKLLIPPGKKLLGFKVTSQRGKLKTKTYCKIRLNSGMIPYSFYRDRVWRNLKNKAQKNFARIQKEFYQQESFFPEKNWEYMGIQKLGGWKIAIFNLYPIQYNPASGKLVYSKNFKIKLQLGIDKAKSNEVYYPHILKSLNQLVDNPETLKNIKSSRNPEFNYLIISTQKLFNSQEKYNFKTLAKYLEEEKGLKVKLTSLEEIKVKMKGADLQEKIRNYIRYAFQNWGIKYVLLGGDADSRGDGNIIPTRPLYAKFNWDGRTFAQDLPSDIYYACLDGTFNYNHNDHWGELNDGDNGGDVDLIAEVYVGRAPVQNERELSNFVEKTITAYKHPRNKALFVGENLFPRIWGEFYMNELIKGADTHGFHTAGYNQGNWEIDTMFDHQKRWSSTDLFKKAANNYLIINHIGHSNTGYTMKFYSFYVGRFQNTLPFILYTQGCYCGRFIENDCVIEKLITTSGKTGAFATIANTSYGLGPEDPDPDDSVVTRGASQYLHRTFTDLLNTKKGLGLGELNQLSKEKNIIHWIKEGTARWVYWEATLLGDPAFTPVE